jgi:hypothetical protein
MNKQFTFEEKQEILNNFPNIKLSYENIIHNKVENNYDLYLAIPCGKKSFAWFTVFNEVNVCLIMELMPNKSILDIRIHNCVFNNDLTYSNGTILYGTQFNYKQTNFFSIENIFYWKGRDLTNYNWYYKLECISKLFLGDIKQISYNKKYMIFGLPLLSSNLEDLKKHIDSIEYKIYNIQFRNFKKINAYDCMLYKNFDITKIMNQPVPEPETAPEPEPEVKPSETKIQTKIINNKKRASHTTHTTHTTHTPHLPKQIVFKIKPDIQNDIYHLYCLDEGIETYYKVAYIPDYKTSVMMNRLFRNIKENQNLDLLEESDDEEEFQNDREDRFVHLNVTNNMLCSFNYKFKKWYPISLAPDNYKIIQLRELTKYDKNK